MTGSTASAASGQLKQRVELTYRRLLNGAEPTFTDEFILADLIVDPRKPRRFDDFSGDLSGRFIGAMAIAGMPNADDEQRLHSLLDQILAHQHADGRFGLASLSFESGQLDREHMALLWGNGRMLVGLLEYHSIHPKPSVLDAATRLAEFLHRACDRVSAENLNRKLETAGAYGFICLTQCNEGLAMLHRLTGERKWAELGLRMTTWLAPRAVRR